MIGYFWDAFVTLRARIRIREAVRIAAAIAVAQTKPINNRRRCRFDHFAFPSFSFTIVCFVERVSRKRGGANK